MQEQNLAELRAVTSTRTLRPYDRFGTVVPDLEWLPLSGRLGSGYECFLVRFKPGAASQPHEHTGGEDFLVLEGELEDCDGVLLRAGDFVSYPVGSRHFSRSPAGCLLLVVLRGLNRLLDERESEDLTAGAR